MVRKAVTLEVESPNVTYTEKYITSKYCYETTRVVKQEGKLVVKPVSHQFTFRTDRVVPKVGMMLVGWGGNNGTTVTAGILANKYGVTWNTKDGERKPDYFGSITQASTVRIGSTESGEEIYVPMKDVLPMVSPNDIVIGGWDINDMNLGDAMKRAKVLEYDLQRQLYDRMKELKPLPSIYEPDFIAANQEDRANNVLSGTPQENLETIRKNIRDFKAQHELDKVVVLWTANTERFAELRFGLNDTADHLLASIKNGDREVAPSTIFAVASILEGCPYINGSPQNTFVPGVVELATSKGVYIGGDDFKSGQTKLKSVLVDFLVSAGMKPASIVSYNHLGNNDGKNLSAPKTFRSKEISKSNVVDDMVASNSILYGENEHPDHCIVIKYVPYVGDSKRAMDEYISEIFLGGRSTIAIHNTCEDSLLASPLIIDLVVLTELFTRITYKTAEQSEFQNWHSVLSVLSYLLKAPMVAPGTPVVNALAKQRACIENILRACIGLKADNNMLLEHKINGSLPTEAATGVKTPVKQASYVNGAHVNGYTNGHIIEA